MRNATNEGRMSKLQYGYASVGVDKRYKITSGWARTTILDKIFGKE